MAVYDQCIADGTRHRHNYSPINIIMETIKINRISPTDGYEDGIAEYNGELSAVYALCLYVCQYLWHVDYHNKRMIEKARSIITLGKYNRHCYFWADNDVTYSAMATSGKDAITGEFGSKYDYEPKKI